MRVFNVENRDTLTHKATGVSFLTIPIDLMSETLNTNKAKLYFVVVVLCKTPEEARSV